MALVKASRDAKLKFKFCKTKYVSWLSCALKQLNIFSLYKQLPHLFTFKFNYFNNVNALYTPYENFQNSSLFPSEGKKNIFSNIIILNWYS